jgi:hypothetical protein
MQRHVIVTLTVESDVVVGEHGWVSWIADDANVHGAERRTYFYILQCRTVKLTRQVCTERVRYKSSRSNGDEEVRYCGQLQRQPVNLLTRHTV